MVSQGEDHSATSVSATLTCDLENMCSMGEMARKSMPRINAFPDLHGSAQPTGIHEMSGLQYLDLYCTKLDNQDLAALQHIPHVKLGFEEFSTFLLTSGSWQSLEIWGNVGFSVNFCSPDAFVRGTKRFLFECPSQQAGEIFSVLQAACMRQDMACHKCEHTRGYPGINSAMSTLSNIKLCREPEAKNSGYIYHDGLINLDMYRPSRANFPELYR